MSHPSGRIEPLIMSVMKVSLRGIESMPSTEGGFSILVDRPIRNHCVKRRSAPNSVLLQQHIHRRDSAMNSFRTSALRLLACTAFVLSAPAGAQTPTKSPVATTTTLGNTITVPGVYESTVSSIGALATSATAALKNDRSEQRTLALRRALATALMKGGLNQPIDLRKDSSLGEIAILCEPRENYVTNSIYLNYLNTLAQNIDTVSTKAPVATDIPGAIKLLFASSSYAITNKVAVDAAAIKELSDKVSKNCAADLSGYESAYYDGNRHHSGDRGGDRRGRFWDQRLNFRISRSDRRGHRYVPFHPPTGPDQCESSRR
jgi:hypothetical protein